MPNGTPIQTAMATESKVSWIWLSSKSPIIIAAGPVHMLIIHSCFALLKVNKLLTHRRDEAGISDKSQQPLIFIYNRNIGNIIAVDLFKQGHNVLVGVPQCSRWGRLSPVPVSLPYPPARSYPAPHE